MSMNDVLNSLDVVIFSVLAAVHILAWIEWNSIARKREQEENRYISFSGASRGISDDKSMGSGAIMSAAGAGVAAVSILIPASMLVVQVSAESLAPLPLIALDNIFRAAIWFTVSLFLGLLTIYLTPIRAIEKNVITDSTIGIPFGLQLFALFSGMIRFVIGLYFTIYR